MDRRLLALCSMVVVVVALVWLRRPDVSDEPAAAAAAPTLAAPGEAPVDGELEVDADRPDVDRAPVEAGTGSVARAPADPMEEPGAATAAVTVAVEVVDRLGAAVEGVSLLLGEDHVSTTDEGGRAAIELFGSEPLAALRAREVGPGFVALGSGLRTDGSNRPVLVVAPARTVAGRVVGVGDGGLPEGPLEGAQVRVAAQRLLDDLPLLLGDFRRPWNRLGRSTAADGRFELPDVPDLPGVLLRATKSGYRPSEDRVPAGAVDFELQLERRPPTAEPEEVTAEVRVLDRDGRPMAGALVGLERSGAYRFTETGADGWARLVLLAGSRDTLLDGAPPALVARHADHGVERFEDLGRMVAEALPDPPPPITLRFRRAPLVVAGRLTDVDGAPLVGWRVRAYRATPGGDYDAWPTLASPWLEGELDVEVGPDGAFELGPLLPRSYPLLALSPDGRTAVHHPGEVEAGTRGLEWRLGPPDLLPRLAGRVVDGSGAPVEGAVVRVSSETWRHEQGGAASWRTAARASEPTGPDGRFELERVPGRVGRIDVDGDLFPPLEPLGLDPAEIDDPEDALLVVARQKVLRLELTGDAADDAYAFLMLEVLDAEGTSLPVRWGGASATPLNLRHAHEPLYTVPSGAVEARLVRRGPAASPRPGEDPWTDELLETWPLGPGVTHLRIALPD